jgi:hypothetical protein
MVAPSVNDSDPYDVLNIESAAAGTDLSPPSLFRPHNTHFIPTGQFNRARSTPDGALLINVLPWPEA